MKDQIICAESVEEAQKLGWTFLGKVGTDLAKGLYIFCKAGDFVMFRDAFMGPEIHFFEYILPGYAGTLFTLTPQNKELYHPSAEPCGEKYGFCFDCKSPLSENDFLAHGYMCVKCGLKNQEESGVKEIKPEDLPF